MTHRRVRIRVRKALRSPTQQEKRRREQKRESAKGKRTMALDDPKYSKAGASGKGMYKPMDGKSSGYLKAGKHQEPVSAEKADEMSEHVYHPKHKVMKHSDDDGYENQYGEADEGLDVYSQSKGGERD